MNNDKNVHPLLMVLVHICLAMRTYQDWFVYDLLHISKS